MAVTASRRSFFIRIMSALSMATSVPAPIAIPTSAAASAGASLIPSPIIATLCPCAFNSLTFFSLSCGSTSATTSAIPSFCRTASAVRRLSPVSMMTLTPIFSHALIASWEVALTVSDTPMMPKNLPSCATRSGVMPSSAMRFRPSAAPCGNVIFFSCKNARLPT